MKSILSFAGLAVFLAMASCKSGDKYREFRADPNSMRVGEQHFSRRIEREETPMTREEADKEAEVRRNVGSSRSIRAAKQGVNRGTVEKVEMRSKSTPTPTPDDPMNRPLDPVGRPIGPPTP